jgi:hypothetical protein
MQLDALAYLQRIALEHPDSGVRIVELTDVFGSGIAGGVEDTAEGVWFGGKVAGYEVLREGSEGVMVRYGSVVALPVIFLPWLRKRLEAEGVKFERIEGVKALGELKTRGADVVINATGAGVMGLEDVKDGEMTVDRTHVTVVRSEFLGAYVHRGPGVYTYIFGRGDGTAVVGGTSEAVQKAARPKGQVHEDVSEYSTRCRCARMELTFRQLFSRAFEHLPEYFPSPNPGDYEVVEDLTGIRPLRPVGVRVEKEVIDGQKVVHAYGTTVGGYIMSFGLAKEVGRLVEESLSNAPSN